MSGYSLSNTSRRVALTTYLEKCALQSQVIRLLARGYFEQSDWPDATLATLEYRRIGMLREVKVMRYSLRKQYAIFIYAIMESYGILYYTMPVYNQKELQS